ncbi:MAG: ABC transporter substrate-binding protein, partial [Bacteroidota bacterium]
AMFNPHKMSPYASQFRKLNRIEVDKSNPKKFTIYTSPYMMALASYSNFNPIPAYLYDPEGTLDQYSLADLMEKDKLKDKADLKALADYMYSPDALTTPQFLQGSGPYQLEKWETGRELVLTKRSNWWGDKVTNGNRMLKAVPEQIVYKVIPDVNAAISLMNNNELDVFAKMNWTTFLNQKDKAEFASNHQFHTPDLFGLRMMYINTAKDKLADKRVRRAIAHLMDKEELFNTVFYGYPTATSQLASPAKASYNPDLPEITYDVEKAKTLLKEAGWEDSDGNGIVDKEIAGERVELTLDLSFAIANKDYGSMATLFQASAKKGGVNLVLQGYEGGAFIAQVKSKEYDLAFLGTSDYPFNLDPAMKWATVGPLNYSGFGTPESDDIIRAIRKTADIDKQNELFRELNAIIYDQQPALFICVDKDRIITNKAFGNVATSGLSPGFLINEFDGNSLVEAPINSSNN